MTAEGGANVLGVGLVTAVGMGSAQTAACVLAGLDGLEETAILNARLQPLVMGLLPESSLPPLAAQLEEVDGLDPRPRRMLRLAVPALDEVVSALPESVRSAEIPLLVATPERHPEMSEPIPEAFLDHRALQSGLDLDWSRSRTFETGRAGVYRAVEEALGMLARREIDRVLVGGIDTPLDLNLLALLDREGRLLAPGVMDGFLPGEGAGFLLLGRDGSDVLDGLVPIARIAAAAVGHEPGHRRSDEPYRGDGLAGTFSTLFSRSGPLDRPVQTAWLGLNGESFPAKEWSVASIRSSQEISSEVDVRHPADCFGDIGAALGPVMLGLASLGVAERTCEAPCLVWSSADGPERGAVLIEAASS